MKANHARRLLNDSLRMLAAALAANGIASLRYDKRGIGASAAAMTAESALRLDTYVDNAQAGMNRVLKLVPDDSKQQQASYADPTLPLAPQLVGAIVDFVHTKQAGQQ
jgi:predicted alpha/beta hydrolase